MFAYVPSTDRVIGAAKGVVALILASGALSEVIEMEGVFQAVGCRKGRQARSIGDVLCLEAIDRDDDGRGRFHIVTYVGGEPVGLLRKNESPVKSGKFFCNSEECVSGGDTVENKLSSWHVQVDGGGT
jgi:hypothetical protein